MSILDTLGGVWEILSDIAIDKNDISTPKQRAYRAARKQIRHKLRGDPSGLEFETLAKDVELEAWQIEELLQKIGAASFQTKKDGTALWMLPK